MSDQVVDIETRLESLRQVRSGAADVGRRRERIGGELEGKRKRVAEIEKRARDEFDCEPDELRGMATELVAEADKAIATAKAILNGEATEDA